MNPMKKKRKLKRRLHFFVCTAMLFCFLTGCGNQIKNVVSEDTGGNTDSVLEVHFIDVGQGDATLIKTGEHAMLIDAGENDQGDNVESYIKSKGIEELDYVIGTHPDSDHIGGLDVVLSELHCDEIMMPEVEADTKTFEEVEEAAAETETPYLYPEAGNTYSLGEAQFTVIAPNESYGDDKNNWSVGIVLQHGNNRFLFTGDAESEAEEDILHNGIDISADVYKASHHGSKTGSGEEFLDAVHPSSAVISCGEDNQYGHPSAQTLNSFRRRGIEVYRTDEQGTIVAVSDGENITWNTSPDTSWKQGEPTGSSEEVKNYILNTNTKKYHKNSCQRAETIAEKNRCITDKSKNVLEKEGYTACGLCQP